MRRMESGALNLPGQAGNQAPEASSIVEAPRDQAENLDCSDRPARFCKTA